jgi:TPP-dependent 2-oxoacid decarboxylase
MYKNKYNRVEKGYALIHVLILGTLILLLIINSFTLELSRTKNITSYKNYIIRVKQTEISRVYLLTKLKDLAFNTYKIKTKEELVRYFIENKPTITTEDRRGTLKYDESSGYVFIESYEDQYTIKREVYYFEVLENNMRFSFVKRSYI